VERLFKEAIDAFGQPDVVVHSAGIMPLLLISGGDVETFDKL
jgi:NAD(P)-dependent dehydrogenase (short-subunit alcohol dehydrogenase family)